MTAQDYIQAREIVFAAMQSASPLGQGMLQGINKRLMEQRLEALRSK